MDPVTLLGLASLGGALAADGGEPSKPRIPTPLLPEVVRRLGYHWKSFHLSPCGQCSAPSWCQPCPWCNYYPPPGPSPSRLLSFDQWELRFRVPTESWRRKRKPTDPLNPTWLADALIRDAGKVMAPPYDDIAFLEQAKHWFIWPTPEQVWTIFRDRDRPPTSMYFSERDMQKRELERMTPRELRAIDRPQDYHPEIAQRYYNREIRLNSPADLKALEASWPEEFKQKLREWKARAPQRRIRRMLDR
jgi:hypothetical protein